MSPRPKKTPTAPAPQAKVFRRKRAAPQPTPSDASAPDYSHTPLDAIPLTGLPPRALIAPNFRMYELTKSDLAARLGIDNGFASEAHLRAAIHLARQVLQPIRDAFGSFSPNSVYRSQKLERALKNKPASWLSTSQHAKGEACDIEPDAGTDPAILTLRHAELESLRAHVFLHGQRPGTYGVYYEYPNPLPDMPSSIENQPLARVLDGLRMHFDA